MRVLQGTIISDKMQKTRVVSITRLKKHKRYNKYYTVMTKVKAHDEKNEYVEGDEVRIKEVRPLSKDKRWLIIELVRKTRLLDNKKRTEE